MQPPACQTRVRCRHCQHQERRAIFGFRLRGRAKESRPNLFFHAHADEAICVCQPLNGPRRSKQRVTFFHRRLFPFLEVQTFRCHWHGGRGRGNVRLRQRLDFGCIATHAGRLRRKVRRIFRSGAGWWGDFSRARPWWSIAAALSKAFERGCTDEFRNCRPGRCPWRYR